MTLVTGAELSAEIVDLHSGFLECSARRTRSNLVRRQQQTCLGIRNSPDEPDALQGLIEGLEAFHAEFDNNVPTAVGGVQRLNFRDAAQRFEHGGRVFAFDCHHGDGANALRFSVWFEPHGKTAYRCRPSSPRQYAKLL